MVIQSTYRSAYQAGWPGSLSRPESPYQMLFGRAQVPTSGIPLKPGYGVLYDQGNDAWRLPTSTTEQLQVTGIVSVDQGSIQSAQSSIGENSDMAVEYEDGDELKICTMGNLWVVAGAELEYGDLAVWDYNSANTTSYQKWTVLTAPTTVAGLQVMGVQVVSPVTVSANGIAEVYISGGRTR